MFCHFFPVAEVQAIASLIEKQAQIVVKHKVVSEASKERKEALLAQYANVTDDEEYPFFLLVVKFTSLTNVSMSIQTDCPCFMLSHPVNVSFRHTLS